MSLSDNFLNKCINEEIQRCDYFSEYKKEIQKWEKDTRKLYLYEFLGFDKYEHDAIKTNIDILPILISIHKNNLPINKERVIQNFLVLKENPNLWSYK